MKWFKEYQMAVHTSESRQMEEAGLQSDETTYADASIDLDWIVGFHAYYEKPEETIVYLANERGIWRIKKPYSDFKRDFDEFLEADLLSRIFSKLN